MCIGHKYLDQTMSHGNLLHSDCFSSLYNLSMYVCFQHQLLVGGSILNVWFIRESNHLVSLTATATDASLTLYYYLVKIHLLIVIELNGECSTITHRSSVIQYSMYCIEK